MITGAKRTYYVTYYIINERRDERKIPALRRSLMNVAVVSQCLCIISVSIDLCHVAISSGDPSLGEHSPCPVKKGCLYVL